MEQRVAIATLGRIIKIADKISVKTENKVLALAKGIHPTEKFQQKSRNSPKRFELVMKLKPENSLLVNFKKLVNDNCT
jgi:F420-0:gamma-glutamyl ligase